MRLQAINSFTTDADGEVVPAVITVTMPIEEAIAIATLFGKLNGYGLQRLGLVDADGPYNCLVGDVINRFWENGLETFRFNIDLATINEAP